MKFIGRERELGELNEMYERDKFGLFILYGRRRVGKTTLLNRFCEGKEAIFYSAEQISPALNLEKFSRRIFDYYGESTLEPFGSWTNALAYIDERQAGRRIVLIIDEFPYIIKNNGAILSEFQHIIDHRLVKGKIFMVLCGSYMSVMEKEVLGSKSPLFGRRTGQLHLKPFDYKSSLGFMDGFGLEEQIALYGAFGGTPLYLEQIDPGKSFEENIRHEYLRSTAYLFEEPQLLLRQEVREPGIYNAIIEAIASGAAKVNEISTKIGEEGAKCLKYINTLCELGILYKETPLGEKESGRRTIYGISDLMFRFWYRYVFANKSLIETGAADAVWKCRIEKDYSLYMGQVFEKVCRDYLMRKNAKGELPFLFTSIGRWWGTDPASHEQVEIDIIADDGRDYLLCECKWTNEKAERGVIEGLMRKADVFRKKRGRTFFLIFSKSGFTSGAVQAAEEDPRILLLGPEELVNV